jgi:uncharacterized tellurite resistance protein B-like protein
VIEKIQQFFKDNLTIDAGNSTPRDDRTLKLTTAALLIEVSRADFDMGPEEKSSIINTLRETFELSVLELDSLVEMAEQEVQQSTSLYQFTRLVNDFYDYEQKLLLINSMWQVAYADNNIHRYEEHIIRKVAELIYVTHADFIRLKHTVRVAQAGK